MQNVFYRIPIGNDMTNCLFQQKKTDDDIKLNWISQ